MLTNETDEEKDEIPSLVEDEDENVRFVIDLDLNANWLRILCVVKD